MTLKIKKWSEHQHYKQRNPPWIKLNRDWIDDRAINSLSDCHFRAIVMLSLVASGHSKNGELPSIEDIAFKLRKNESEIIESLRGLYDFIDGIDSELLAYRERNASNTLATCEQHATPETETETENREQSAEIDPPPLGGEARARDQKTKKQKRIKKTYSKEVEMLWDNYPAQGRNGRAAVDKAWAKHRDASPGVEAVVESFRQHERRCPKWRDGYIKNLTTYINQHCWDDEFPDPKTMTSTKGPKTIHDRNDEVLEMYRRMADDERRENTENCRDTWENSRLLPGAVFDIEIDAGNVDGDVE